MASDGAEGRPTLCAGDVAEILGLKAADLNGQQVTLCKRAQDSGRWEVKLSDGGIKAIKDDNLSFRGISAIEDDGTLMVVGVATDNAKVLQLVKFLEDHLPQASEAFLTSGHCLSPSCGGGAKGQDAAIWLKLAKQAESRLKGLLEDMQKQVEAVDCLDLSKLKAQAKEDLKVARRDLIRFVQVVQERMESVLKRLLPAVRRLTAEVSGEKPQQESNDYIEPSLHEKYAEVFKRNEQVEPDGDSRSANSNGVKEPAPPARTSAAPIPEDATAKSSMKPIVVKFQGKGEKPPPSDNLYIKDLPGWTTEADMKALFVNVGEVQSLKLKTADWGAICFVRLKDTKEAARAIQQLHNTVPQRLAMRATEQEAEKLTKAIARARLQSVVNQMEKGVVITMDLSRPLGITFNDVLRATEVQPGSQSEELGIRAGFRAKSISGDTLETTTQLVAKIQALKADGFKQAAVAFAPPPLVITFDERPLGLMIYKDSEFGLVVVEKAFEPAISKGIKPGAVLTRIERQEVSSMDEQEVSELLRNVTFPVTLFFEQVVSNAKPKGDGKKASGDHDVHENGDESTPTGAWRLTQGLPMTVALTEPLGIFFDDMLVVKDVEETSQAARLGITAGWRARSVAGESMASTDAFVAKIQELKAKATAKVQVAFSPPPLVASFEERPFGFSVDFDENLSLYMVTQSAGAAARLGVKAGMAISRVAGTDACSVGKMKLIQILQQAALPATIIFEAVPEAKETSGSRKRKLEGDIKVVGFDLSLPLGIFFDDDCVAKRITDAAQAAKVGVAEGWTVNGIEDSEVKTTRELVLRIKKFRKKGLTNARISFRCPYVPPPQPELDTADATSSQRPSGSDLGVRQIEIRLQQPLGVKFDPKLNVKGIQEGSQAQNLKICEGWQVCNLNGETFQTTKELVARMQALKGEGAETATLCFKTPAESAPDKKCEAIGDGTKKLDNGVAKGAATTNGESIHSETVVHTNGNDTHKGVQRSIAFDLSQSLGINFDAKLVAKSVQDGSQAMKAGVGTGWRILLVGGESVQTTKELVSRIKALKEQGVQRVDVEFLDPSSQPSNGTTIGNETKEKLNPPVQIAEDVSRKAKPSIEIQKESNPPVQTTEDPPALAKQEKSVAFDLSQPLGINFDAKVVAKSVQEGSQAAKAGVCIGWHAVSVGEEPVQATKELVAKLKALKTQGVEQVLVNFLVETPSAKRQHSAIAEECEVAPSKQLKSG